MKTIKVYRVLSVVFGSMLVFMTLYEWGKQWLFPSITIWGSHIMTIGFSSVVATIAAHVVSRKFQLLLSQLEQEMHTRQQLHEELQKLNASKDKLFSIIAHDVKNCFVAVQSGAKMLTEHFQDSDDTFAKNISAELQKKAQYLFELLDKLLTWARMQQGVIPYKPDTLDISYPFRGTVQLLHEHAARKNITIHCGIDVGTLVYADYHMVETIARNLLSNAVKFTPEGGTITVTSHNREHGVEIAIVDTGVGMSKEKTHQLFVVGKQNITSVGTAGETGTGLGLLLCKEFIEKHGGTMGVESEIGKGSAFTFTLPKATE